VGRGDDPPQTGQATDASIRALSEFLQENRGEIQARWERSLQRILGELAEGFERLDPVLELLDHFARVSEGESADFATMSDQQAPGSDGGLELGPLVTGYVLLRDTVVELWPAPARGAVVALRTLDQAIDQAILAVVRRFGAAQDAAWRALDRMTALAREQSGGGLQDGLLRLVLESTTADCAALLLRDGELLELTAARGFDEDLARGLRMKLGEGFAGAVATRRAPILVRWAARDPLVLGESARKRGVRALYGVPLVDADHLVGVAVMGSLTAFDFSEHDRRLFAALADRACAAIQVDRLRSATAEQERQLAEVQEALRARDRVLSTVAHEVRTPIGIVLMQADAVVHRPNATIDGAWLSKRVISIHRAAERIDRLVEDLVEFTNLRAGRLQFTIETHAPADLIREALDMFTPMAQERGVTVETELSAGLPSLSCDRERILQVLSILACNALRALRDTGMVIIRAQHDDLGVVFSVEDTGPAIDDKEMPHVFERAWRGERGGPGRSGVGLAICKGIVEAHGGRIWGVSGARGGVTFCFAVPTAQA
jgi:signal transduction histidine kinase